MEKSIDILKENIITITTGIISLILIAVIATYTYSLFTVTATNSNIIAGTAENLSVSVDVSKVAPSGNGKLIPQLDAYITSAIKGRNGSCIDDNNNTVCHTYKITATNNGSSVTSLNGTVTINKKNNPSLKWARYIPGTNPTLVGEIKETTNIELTSNEEFNAGQTKEYYIVVWISELGIPQVNTGNYVGVVDFITAQNMVQTIGSTILTMSNYTVGSTSQTTFPKGSYTVNPNCTNATTTFDYENWAFRVSNLNTSGIVTCSPILTTKNKQYLNSYIKDTLTGTTQGNGQVVNENGYRYEGENPNNYIRFNNELWRIIGVFDSSSHGQTGQYLTKIIRNDSIGGYAWDGNNKNNWPESSLYKILNNYYYTSSDGSESGYCYKYGKTVTGDCDFTIGGISDTYRPMIKNVTWYLGTNFNSNVTSSNMYTFERSQDDTYYYVDNRTNKTTTGYIGLMYASDYGYSVLASNCSRTTILGYYAKDACAGNSWLYKEGYEWTIAHVPSNAIQAFNFHYGGGILNIFNVNDSSGTRPVLYLDSSVYILSGNGSKATPYIITM